MRDMTGLSVSVATLVVLSLTLTGYDAYTDPVLDPVTLTDKNNNTANNDSVITWAQLPAGQPYTTDTNVTDDQVTGTFLKLMRGFVHILQPKDIDYELVSGLMTGETDLVGAAKTLGLFVVGFGICLVIGIIFLIFFPLVGCCFCCCRLCGNCGGKKLQKEPIKDCKCVVFSLILNVMVTGVFMGAMMTILMDDRLSYSFKYITNATESNIEDVKTFLNNTAEEVEFIALDGFNFTAEVLLRDLNNVGALLGVPVRDGLSDVLGIDSAIDEIINMDNKIDDVTVAMEETDSAHTAFTTAYDALETALSTLQTNLATTLAETDCTSVPDCNSMDSSLVAVSPAADPALIPSLNSSLQSLYDLQNQNITASALEGKKSFNELPERIQNDTAAQITEIETMLTDFSSQIQDNLGSIDDLTKNTDQLNGVQDSLRSYTDLLNDYDGYRSAGFWAISLMLMIMVLLWVLGLCIGPFAYNSYTRPTERRCCCSNCAGIFLMAAAGLSWIMSVLFMLFTFFPFLIGYPLEKFVCGPLTDPEYKIFKTLLDEPGGLLSADGYFMGELLFGNGSIELTLSGVLESCKNNEPAYEAMKLENLIDLDQITNYEDTLNITEQVEQMTADMSTVEVISQDTIDQLNQFSSATQVNYTAMYLVLSLNLTLTALDTYHQDLTTAKDAISAGSTQNDLVTHLATLQGIIDTEYTDAVTAQTTMYSKTQALEAVAGTIPDQVNTTINATEALETRIQTGYGDDVLDQEIDVYANRLIGTVDSFVDYVVDKLTTELGRCEPVWNVWESLIQTGLCDYVVDTFNGFWFALGMATFCLFFGIIFSIKLAKYYRTMKHLDGEEEQGDNQSEAGSQAADDEFDNHNGHLAKKGSGPPPFATSQPYTSPQGGAVGKAGGSSRPPSYSAVYPNNDHMDF